MASRRHVRVSSLILLLVVALLSAWGLTRCALFDRSLLTHTPCAPPCWYGIIPGETSEEEAAEILRTLSFINASTIRVKQIAPWKVTHISFDYFPKLREADSGLIVGEDGIVKIIRLLSYPPRSIRLADVLAVQGEPDAVIASVLAHNNLELVLVFPKKGLDLWCGGVYVGPHEASVIASDKLRVSIATYFQPMSLAEYFQHVQRTERISIEDMIKYYTQPWPGFGGELKLPGRR